MSLNGSNDLVGQVFGRYRIDARVGAGGMGEVYRAHDIVLDRPVALKCLLQTTVSDATRLRRFQLEAKAASSLNHPHILVVHDFGNAGGCPFIVTEFVEGETLRERLDRGPIAAAEAVEIARQIADALAAAHARGIVHRDIKPENIMLRPDGHVKVLDFGLAKLASPSVDPATVTALTQPGVALGSPRYMSPEQLRGQDVDARSDVWSLGVTLYEMLAGHRPFADTSAADLIGAILHSAPAPCALDALAPILDRALRKIPIERYADARDLMLELVAVKRQLDRPESGDAKPSRKASAAAHNFPLNLTAFVGREDDVTGLSAALLASRLVTLTGAGGVGKTRLALEVATALVKGFPDGAWLIDLAPLSDPALVVTAVADVLLVKERTDRPIVERLCDHLESRTILIVLDNCEHLIDACAALVEQLVAACPTVRVLATSRETLNVRGEVTWRLRSLSVPDNGQDLPAVGQSESVQLFLQRAASARPGFVLTAENAAAVAQICRRLDGLPLALELAAARVGAMSPLEIAERLDDRFRLLTGGSRMAVPRQRTLEATIAWSYDLLAEPERLLFARLTVFSGGWTLAAAERVCGDEGLHCADIADRTAHLVERSMVVADQTADGHTRYRMLDSFRQFGRDHLIASGAMPEVRDRHLAWAVALSESWKPGEPRSAIAAELDNLRTALEWSYETGRYESGLRIIANAPIGRLDERKRLLKLLLPFADQAPMDVQGTVLYTAGGLAFMIGDWQWGLEAMRASAEVNAAVGNAMRHSMSLTYVGACHWGLGALDDALAALERALDAARAAHNTEALARALFVRTWLETERDVDRAEVLAIEAERESAKLANVFDFGHSREARAFIHCLKGDARRGAETLADVLPVFKNIQINCGSHVLETAAAWAAMTGRFELGAEFLGCANRIREETGDKPRPWEGAVQNVWLPKIGASLAPEIFSAAHRRGMERPPGTALDFAERELRATLG